MPTYYKLFRKSLTHYNYTFKEGVNLLNEEFRCDEGGQGGFHFAEEDDIYIWINLYIDILNMV